MDEANIGSLRRISSWRDETTIIPFSGIQILDFEFDLSQQKIRHEYIEYVETGTTRFEKSHNDQSGAKFTSILRNRKILCPVYDDEENEWAAYYDSIPRDSRVDLTVKPKDALKPFLEQWMPVPVLRIRKDRDSDGHERFDRGPTTWARVRVVNLDQKGNDLGENFRVQLAFDTALSSENPADTYLTPDIEDSLNSREFRFVSDPDQMSWFLTQPVYGADGETVVTDNQKWVSDWLDDIMKKFFSRKIDNRRVNRPIDEDSELEGWARYISYIRLIDELVKIPKIMLPNTVSERDKESYVDVDLVLDVGNSRTCGLMIEQFPSQGMVDFTDSYPLAFRDLTNPEFYYRGLIDSRVEFSEASFGIDRFARASGRNLSFLWPSMVRIGPEASRLTESEEGTETISGISSPKRYLWDDQKSNQNWRFHNHIDPNSFPRIAQTIMKYINESGDCIEQVIQEENDKLRSKKDETSKNVAILPRFSRSSMYCFMLVEIISHALVQINDPAERSVRKQSNLPRRLRNIIITIPTATPIQEQAIFKSRAESALKLVWEIMKETGKSEFRMDPPNIRIEWDEASCTQMVFLYDEITQKFNGQIDNFFKLIGKQRSVEGSETKEQSLRICSIDVGAGTTDMMITTYTSEDNRLIKPKQNFREGFRIAGDDIMREIISDVILESLINDIHEKSGKSSTGNSLSKDVIKSRINELFGEFGQDQLVKQMQRQFNLRFLVPLAIKIIQKCENLSENSDFSLPVSEIFEVKSDAQSTQGKTEALDDASRLSLPQNIIDYLNEPLKELGLDNWNICDWVVSFSSESVDKCVQKIMNIAIENMVRVIDHLDCDYVLLSGRPSRLSALRELIENTCVIRPDRLISMHDYRVGLWYPFRKSLQTIGDPKTTVVVGGLLMMLAEIRLENFTVSTKTLNLESTAKFIGPMELDGNINNDKVLFSEDSKEEEAQLRMHSPVHIGSRQLPFENWTSTPIYRLDFTDHESMRHRTPLNITLRTRKVDVDDEIEEDADHGELLKNEALKEAIEIVEAEDSDGKTVRYKTELSLRLHTLGLDKRALINDYWLDTGIVIRN